jgi:hypothetical protein
MEEFIHVSEPLKELTMLVSQGGDALSISSVIPYYHFCTETLKQSLKKFEDEEDIYIGLSAAIEKLEHYYDQISPIAGIALILDPRTKKKLFKS